MLTIHKYVLNVGCGAITEFESKTCDFLTIQTQGDSVVAWSTVNTDDETVKNRVICLATGQDCEILRAQYRYLGTVQQSYFVWHFFAIPSEKNAQD